MEIKYQLVETMTGFRQHEQLLNSRKEVKGYTFTKARANSKDYSRGVFGDAALREETPGPTEYSK